MKTISLAIFLIATTWISAFCQDEVTFKVLVNKGKNEVKSGDGWHPLKTGAALKKDDVLKLENNAYVGLLHVENGRPLEVKEAGNHKVVDLASRVSGPSNVLNKYTDFILSSNTERKNKLSATGAVHRGPKSLPVFLPKPEMAVVYNNKVTFAWQKDKAPYVVTLKSMFGDDLLTTETNDTTFTIDLGDEKFKYEDNILVDVYPKSEPGKKQDPAFTLKKMSAADKERFKHALSEVSQETGEENALSKVIMAAVYEQNKLFIDASSAYLEAIKLAPDVAQFREDYEAFLVRHAMKEAHGGKK